MRVFVVIAVLLSGLYGATGDTGRDSVTPVPRARCIKARGHEHRLCYQSYEVDFIDHSTPLVAVPMLPIP